MSQQESVRVSGVSPADEKEQFAHCEDAEHVSSVPHRLPKDVIKKLSELNPGYVLSVIALDWALIIAAIWLSERYWHPVFYILAVIYIGSRIHGLAVLVHDAAHYRLLPNKKANDLLSDLLLGFPVVLPTHFYRATRHFAHHRNIGLPDDPHIWQTYHDNRWVFPKTRVAFAWQMLEYALHGPKETMMRMYYMFAFRLANRRSVLLPLLYYGTVAALVISFDLGMIFLCYWLVPLMFVFPLIYNFRLMAEHMGISEELDKIGAGTRTTTTNWIGKHLISPHNVNYHLEHHRYPSVPFFRLPELHKAMIDYSGDKEELHVTQGYWRVLQALTACE